jgi:hypothetical protein
MLKAQSLSHPAFWRRPGRVEQGVKFARSTLISISTGLCHSSQHERTLGLVVGILEQLLEDLDGNEARRNDIELIGHEDTLVGIVGPTRQWQQESFFHRLLLFFSQLFFSPSKWSQKTHHQARHKQYEGRARFVSQITRSKKKKRRSFC